MRRLIISGLVVGSVYCVAAQEPTPTPGPIRETVTVTISRIETGIGDTPASVVTINRGKIESSAAPATDDILRQTAGFSIFRRSSSRNANPTTQGASLRGIGASGASRSAVFYDGVPLADAFGGWIQWGRVTNVAIETVEVMRGGASSLYGNASLSGAINIVPRRPRDKYHFTAEVFGGTQRTVSGAMIAGIKLPAWQLDVSIAAFQTRGYKPVDESARGPVDAFAGVRNTNFGATVSRIIRTQTSFFLRPSYFGEVRTNGTGLQTNRTHIRQMVFGGEAGFAKSSSLKWRAFGGTQTFDQVFSAVNAARTLENLTRVQRVPAQTLGISGQFSMALASHTLLIGLEARTVRGSSDETAFANSRPTALIDAGGRELNTGFFAQHFLRIGAKLIVVGRMRYDRWKNYAGSTSTRTLSTGVLQPLSFADRIEDAANPHAAALYNIKDSVSIYAAASRSFRSPTLNELYRTFRVGNVLTLANESLLAERAGNIEGGLSYKRRRMSIRGGGYWTIIDKTISNATLFSTPTLITRQRRNAGETQARGVEAEVEMRGRRWNFDAGYLFADSRIHSFLSSQPVGLRIPQVPRHQFTFQARYTLMRWTLAVQGRAASTQFDDDLNQFRLEPYGQLDVYAARRINEKLKIYAAVENAMNSRYSVGKTPIRTVSSPANLRVGLRWN